MARKLKQNEEYWAKIVLLARDGDPKALEIMQECPSNCPPEIIEWHLLSQDLSILCNSPENDRLCELDDKYETDAVYATKVW